MKTQFSRRTKALTPSTAIVLAVLLIVSIVFISLRVFAPSSLSAIVAPLWNMGSALSGSFMLPGDAARLKMLESENESLRNENRLLKEGPAAEKGGTSAPVLSRPPMTPYDVLVLGVGTDTGVYDGMHVFAHGVPIGVIEAAGRTSAKAALFSAAGHTTEAWAGENRVPLTLVGAGAGAFRADAPREAGILEGDIVYISSVPAGVVALVETHPSAPRAVISVRPLANIFSLTEVNVFASPAP